MFVPVGVEPEEGGEEHGTKYIRASGEGRKKDHKHQLSRQTAIDVVLNVVLNAFLTVERGASYTQPQEGGVGGGVEPYHKYIHPNSGNCSVVPFEPSVALCWRLGTRICHVTSSIGRSFLIPNYEEKSRTSMYILHQSPTCSAVLELSVDKVPDRIFVHSCWLYLFDTC